MRFYTTLVLRGWWAILLALAAAAVLLGRHVPDLKVEAGTSVLLDADDPDLAYYEATRPVWGYDEYAILCVSGRDWIAPEGVAVLRDLERELGTVPHASRVVSVLDVPLLRQQPGPALDLRALPTLRDEGVDLARAREELLGHTQVRGNLLSEDGRSASFLVPLDVPPAIRERDARRGEAAGRPPDAAAAAELRRLEEEASAALEEQARRRSALVEGVRAVARSAGARLGTPARLSGITVINVNLLEHLRHDLRVFGVAALALFVAVFAAVYRRARFVVLPVLTCLLPVAIVVGGMAVLRMPVTVITASLPLLLFVLMLPYTVYFVEQYRERRMLRPEESGVESTLRAAPAIFLPCLFSCTTTMAGFVALRTSHTRPVRDFGLMMAAGMAVGLVVVFLAIPSMSRPLPTLDVPAERRRLGPGRVVGWLARLSLRHPVAVAVGALVLLALSVAGTARITAESKFTTYFRRGGEVYQGLEYIDRTMGGTTPLEIHLRGAPGYFLTEPGIAALRAVAAYFEDVPETGNVRSLATLVEELRKKNPAVVRLLPVLARLPDVRRATRELADETWSSARVLVRMRETAPTLHRRRVLDGLAAHLASRPELAGLETRTSGVFLLYANMLGTLMRTQQETFWFVLGSVYLMVLVLFRSVWLSALALGTQVLPTLATLGLMGWSGIPLDLVTVMIASVSMGVGIDASIQYAYRYRAECARQRDRAEALLRTHGTVGRAIWIATSVIVAGFLVLMLSDFRPSAWFGLLTGVAMLVSQLAALTVLPALLRLTGLPRRRRPPSGRAELDPGAPPP